ncbi:hypothetical protein G9P44_002260 [Scheffersomyces stipitis]|nr:hypothetical protein G9P44_002260 [Scheffersomyces stipitis]
MYTSLCLTLFGLQICIGKTFYSFLGKYFSHQKFSFEDSLEYPNPTYGETIVYARDGKYAIIKDETIQEKGQEERESLYFARNLPSFNIKLRLSEEDLKTLEQVRILPSGKVDLAHKVDLFAIGKLLGISLQKWNMGQDPSIIEYRDRNSNGEVCLLRKPLSTN